MEIIHRIGITASKEQQIILQDLGVWIKEVNVFTTFEISEHTAIYAQLKPLIDQWNLMDISVASFDSHEMNNAAYLAFRDCWANGYPMPDQNIGYKSMVYDTNQSCVACGVGLVQKAPFQLKNKPSWKKKKVFMLHWIYDEIFIRKDVYDRLFQPLNINCRPVLLHKNQAILEDTVQLILPIANHDLPLPSQPFVVCDSCGQKKYTLITRDYFPSYHQNPEFEIFKTKEYFGFDSHARQYIVMSQAFREKMLQEGIQLNYIPCKVAVNR